MGTVSTAYFCNECGDRIWRAGYKVDNKYICRKCLEENYRFEVESEEDKDVKKD